jgi:prepilin-type N-terminal cleavage/methylation domain-containing protein
MLNKKGFTILELVIVLMIIIIIALIGISSLFNLKQHHSVNSSPTSNEYSKSSKNDELVQTITGIIKVDLDHDRNSVTIYNSNGVYAYTPVCSPELKIEYSSTNIYKKMNPDSLIHSYCYYFKGQQ